MFDSAIDPDSSDLTEAIQASDADELSDGICQLAGLEAAVRTRLLEFIVAYDRKELWRSDGASCMASWLSYRLGLAFRTAAELVEIAHALTHLPKIAAAYDAGLLSWDKLRAVVAIATPQTDEELAETAQQVSIRSLENAARRTRAARREGPTRDPADRFLTLRHDENSWLLMRGHLPPDQGAVVTAAIERLEAQVPPSPDGIYAPGPVRAADALVELASTRLAEDSDADRATVVIHVDVPVLTSGEGVAETASGELIDAASAQRMVCDSRLQFVNHAPDGRALGIGNTSRNIPPWLMRQVKRRDGGCRFPGCGRKRYVNAHHIEHWPRGGPTDLHNLLTLCVYHHRLVHNAGWNVRGDPAEEVEFVKPDGSVLDVGPPHLRPEIRERLLGQPA